MVSLGITTFFIILLGCFIINPTWIPGFEKACPEVPCDTGLTINIDDGFFLTIYNGTSNETIKDTDTTYYAVFGIAYIFSIGDEAFEYIKEHPENWNETINETDIITTFDQGTLMFGPASYAVYEDVDPINVSIDGRSFYKELSNYTIISAVGIYVKNSTNKTAGTAFIELLTPEYFFENITEALDSDYLVEPCENLEINILGGAYDVVSDSIEKLYIEVNGQAKTIECTTP